MSVWHGDAGKVGRSISDRFHSVARRLVVPQSTGSLAVPCSGQDSVASGNINSLFT